MKNKNINASKLQIFLIHSLLILLGISQYLEISLLNIGISILIFILMIFYTIEIKVIILFILLPFFNLFSIRIGSTSLYYLYLIVVLYSILKKNNWMIKKNRLMMIICGMLITFFWGELILQIKWLFIFIFLCIMCDNKILEKVMPLIIKHISIATIEASIVGYIMMITEKSIYNKSIVYLSGKTIIRFAGLIGDSVFFSQFCVVLVSCIIVFNFLEKLSLKFSIISVIILSWFVLITYSKTGIILLIFILISFGVLYVKQNIKYKRTLIKCIVFIFIFLFLGLVIYKYILLHQDSELIRSFLLRFSAKDLWTGRNSVSENYWQKLNSNVKYFFRGMSISTYINDGVIVGATMITRAHNIYLETVCLFGVIPTIIITFLALRKINRVIKKNNIFSYQIIPLITLLISGVSLHGHIEWPYYFLILLCYSTLKYTDFNNYRR